MADDWPWIDLRGRIMLHPPWGDDKASCPMSGEVLSRIFSAYIEEGGLGEILCELLNQHMPEPAFVISPKDLQDGKRSYSLEFYFYLFDFAKILLDNPYFRYTIGEDTQLPGYHCILEQGPMKLEPWLSLSGGPMVGYLSVINMRSMFIYTEEAAPAPPYAQNIPRSRLGLQLSREALEFLNLCAPARFRVERQFFDREEILISFEYLYYIGCILELLLNDLNFVYNSLYYGFVTSSQLVRTIFKHPYISPFEGFLQWQNRTNTVYNLTTTHRGRTIWIKVGFRRQLQTGMFDIYQGWCIEAIRQACPAIFRAFMELATGNRVKSKVLDAKDDPESFIIKLRWKKSLRFQQTAGFAAIGGILAAAGVWLIQKLVPGNWQSTTLSIVTIITIAISSALTALERNHLRHIKSKSIETQKVIDDQFARLKQNAQELLQERDNLEMKVAERTQELDAALKSLQALDAAKTNFIANVSHELRTPLTLLSVPLEEIRKGRYGNSLPIDHPIIPLIERNVERLSIQISQLLDFARLDLGTMPFSPEPLALLPYLQGLIAELQSIADRKGLGLELQNSSGLTEIHILVDHALFETAMLNLINNALKFTETGIVQIIVQKGSAPASIAIAVKDTGIGFTDNFKDMIFQRFTQAEPHDGNHRQGAGLGLALVKEIADKHGWHVEAESQPGTGSSFTLDMPLCAPAHEPDSGQGQIRSQRQDRVRRAGSALASAPQSSPGCSDPADRDTIMLLEDNPDMAAILTHILEKHFSLCWYRSGHEALQALESQRSFVLILCDVMMPGMNGFTFREHLKQSDRYKDIPFIFLTALAEPGERLHGFECGATDYIQKPFNADELLFRIQSILAVGKTGYRQALSDSQAAGRLVRLASTQINPAEAIFAQLQGGHTYNFGISPSEIRVLELLRQGLQDKEIAQRLSISPRTVSSHLGTLYRKTNTGNRVELLAKVYPQGK